MFHYYQLTIRSLRVGKYPLYMMDIILWIIMIIIIAAALLVINQGEMRVYVFIALLLGGLVYFKAAARRLHQPLYCMGRATAFMLKAIYSSLFKSAVRVKTWLRNRSCTTPMPPPDDRIEKI